MTNFSIGSTDNYSKINERSVLIAMAQIICIDNDRSGNLVRIENAIIEAKEKNADLYYFLNPACWDGLTRRPSKEHVPFPAKTAN